MRVVKVSLMIFAFVSTLLMVGSIGTVASTSTPIDNATPADADLSRVLWQAEHYSNPGFEIWNQWYSPDDVSSYFIQEEYTNYATAPWPVSEGSRSFLLQAKALAPIRLPEARLTRGTWIFWNNPTNLTLSMDWYIENLATPIDGDIFELRVYLGNPGDRILHYYLGCEETGISNSSQAYFLIDGPTGTWNTLSRNITEDFFAVFGNYPTEFQYFHVALTASSPELSRVFVDDIQMANGTVIIGGSTENGNFEAGGSWYNDSDFSPALVSQSSLRVEGDYSLNLTVDSNGNQSRASVSYTPNLWISADNPDTFKFSWRMEERTVSDIDTRSYLYVACNNGTDDFFIYYMLTYGDTFMVPTGNVLVINATGFNTTGQWHSFQRSIYADLADDFEFETLQIDEIEIYNYAREAGARTEILIDDISLYSGALSDMGYENQGAVGERIYAWRDYDELFTVTDMAHTGNKAANITLADGDSLYLEQRFGNLQVNDETDLWIDLYWYLADNTGTGNELYLEFDMYDSIADEWMTLAYFFANTTVISGENGFDAYIMLDQINTEGAWHNMQRNLYDDCVDAFGAGFEARILGVYLIGESDSGGRLEVLLDDVFIYEDPEPLITNIIPQPIEPRQGQETFITASVYDPSIDAVTLYYRVNNGTWISVPMVLDGTLYNATIPALMEGDDLDIYILAADLFGNTAISSTSSFEVTGPLAPPPPPAILPFIALAGVIVAFVIVVLFYVFYLKPKQAAN